MEEIVRVKARWSVRGLCDDRCGPRGRSDLRRDRGVVVETGTDDTRVVGDAVGVGASALVPGGTV